MDLQYFQHYANKNRAFKMLYWKYFAGIAEIKDEIIIPKRWNRIFHTKIGLQICPVFFFFIAFFLKHYYLTLF